MINYESWNEWGNIHSEPDQQKRLCSGKSGACTPISVDSNHQEGVFRGSSGTYATNLSSCTCGDFMRRRLPCKHMYRLAIELGAIEEIAISNLSLVPTPKKDGIPFGDAVTIVESLSDDTQKLLKNILSDISAKNPYAYVSKCECLNQLLLAKIVSVNVDLKTLLLGHPRNDLNELIAGIGVVCKKNMRREVLVDWCLENIPDKIVDMCNKSTTVVLTPAFSPRRSNLYKYLHRKFDDLSIFGEFGETSVRLCDTELPYDIATEYLIKYGYYKR